MLEKYIDPNMRRTLTIASLGVFALSSVASVLTGFGINMGSVTTLLATPIYQHVSLSHFVGLIAVLPLTWVWKRKV